MSDLTDFLLARIAEREKAARKAQRMRYDRPEDAPWEAARRRVAGGASYSSDPLIALTSPARVLAECEAKRRIVARCAKVIADEDGYYLELNAPEVGLTCSFILQDMALAYADHPEYREEWRP